MSTTLAGTSANGPAKKSGNKPRKATAEPKPLMTRAAASRHSILTDRQANQTDQTDQDPPAPGGRSKYGRIRLPSTHWEGAQIRAQAPTPVANQRPSGRVVPAHDCPPAQKHRDDGERGEEFG